MKKLLTFILVLIIPALAAGLFELDTKHNGFEIDIKTQANEIDKQIDTNSDKTKEISDSLKRIDQMLDNIKTNAMTKADYEEFDRRYK